MSRQRLPPSKPVNLGSWPLDSSVEAEPALV